MKRLWIATALLLAVLGGTLLHNHSLRGLTEELSSLLTLAQSSTQTGDWAEAQRFTLQASDLWHGRDVYLHTLLHHGDIDEIHVSFREVEEYLIWQETGEYSAANAKLITQIELLYEAEQLTLKNLF